MLQFTVQKKITITVFYKIYGASQNYGLIEITRYIMHTKLQYVKSVYTLKRL